MDTETCTGKRGLFKCRGRLLPYDSAPGITKQAFCTKCYSEWIISIFGDGCVKFEKRSPCPITMPKNVHLVTDRENLRKGDHVTWNDGSTIHHGIVGKLVNTDEVRVFYIHPNGKNEITKTTLDLTKSSLYLVDYSSCDVSGDNTQEQIILRARSHLKRTGTFTSSRQFAIFCKSGYLPRLEVLQHTREIYNDILAVYPTMFSLEFWTNVAILVFNILLSILVETLVECAKCSRRLETACTSRTYWFLSEILLLLFEGVVFLFYVVYELYFNRKRAEEDSDYLGLRSSYWRVIPYFSEYVLGVGLASLSMTCNLRRRFCVTWCKVLVGVACGILGKIAGHVLGNCIQKHLQERYRRRYIVVND